MYWDSKVSTFEDVLKTLLYNFKFYMLDNLKFKSFKQHLSCMYDKLCGKVITILWYMICCHSDFKAEWLIFAIYQIMNTNFGVNTKLLVSGMYFLSMSQVQYHCKIIKFKSS